jgi:hypothetical protein
MKTYFVVFAQDVPHYGLVEINATCDEQALAKARAYWKRVQRNTEPWPLTDPEYDSSVLARIVEITDEGGRQVAADTRLDTYLLTTAPTELSVKLIDNASQMHAALKEIIVHATTGLAGNMRMAHGELQRVITITRAALAPVEGGAP